MPRCKLLILGMQTRTDSSGCFAFSDSNMGNTEVHISASGFEHLHKDLNVSETDLSNLTFILKRSPIEVIDIVSTPLHMSSMESPITVSVVVTEALRRQQNGTLCDTLEKWVDLYTNFHPKVASTPVL
jgi:iron complex outermembrane receptor protein